MPNHRAPFLFRFTKARGNKPWLAAAYGISAVTIVQPLSAPMPEMTAVAATSLPTIHALPNIVWNAADERRAVVDQLRRGARGP